MKTMLQIRYFCYYRYYPHLHPHPYYNYFRFKVFEEHFSGKSGNYIHTHAMTPPLLVESVHLEPSANNNGGHCLRTELEGCMTTVTGGEEVTEGTKCNVSDFLFSKRSMLVI